MLLDRLAQRAVKDYFFKCRARIKHWSSTQGFDTVPIPRRARSGVGYGLIGCWVKILQIVYRLSVGKLFCACGQDSATRR